MYSLTLYGFLQGYTQDFKNEQILLEYEKRVNRYYLKDPFKNVTNSQEQVDHDGSHGILYNCIVDQ